MAVSIRAPYAGAGLITIERDRVYRHQWFKTTTTSSVQRITLPEDFEGNGYVTVQFVRDPDSDELFISPLSYGVAPFGADLRARTLTVGLTAPKVVKPGARADDARHARRGVAGRGARGGRGHPAGGPVPHHRIRSGTSSRRRCSRWTRRRSSI